MDRDEPVMNTTVGRENTPMTHHQSLMNLRTWMGQQIFGQEQLVDRMLICLLAGGHVLVEGAPGLAKT